MSRSLVTTLGASLLLATACFAAPANAGIVFQTATPGATPNGGFVVQGDGTTGGSNIFGAAFTLTQQTGITAIGGNFLVSNGSSTGTIFGAIIPLASLGSFPSASVEQLATIALGEVVFGPLKDGENFASLELNLGPGTYAVVFGSGLFGASGDATLADNNVPVGSPNLFEDNFASGPPTQWDAFAPTDTDVAVVPEPASLAVFGFGLAMAAVARRRSSL